MRVIRWGVLGTGSISDEFVAGLKHAPSVELTAVASRDSARAEDFARRHGFSKGVSLEHLLRSSVDVVYVASPPQQHKAHALACLEAGKAVLLEKPFAMNAAEAREVVACARRLKLFCMEAMWMRFMPAVRELVNAVKHGRYGAVRSIEASLGFAHADPLAARDGSLLDLGVYPLSLVHALLGAPSRVKASGDLAEHALLLEYPGAQAVVRSSFKSQLRNDAVIWCEQGRVQLEAPLYRSESFSVAPVSVPASAGGAPSKLSAVKAITQAPALRRWVQKAKGLAEPRVTMPAIGNGYAHEAIEVNDCLRGTALESAVMPLDESIAVIQTVDQARAASAA